MPTLRDVLEEAERRSFVDREDELARFGAWLDADGIPSALNLVGRGGVGKTALLREFERLARDRGRAVTAVDAAALTPDAEGFVVALGGNDVSSVADRLNAEKAVLIIDTFEQIVSLRRFLHDELLASLEPGVRIVIAGRQPLLVGADRAGPWRHVVEEMHLDALSQQHVDEYLRRRGLSGHPRAAEIAHVSRGHPLALCLAADVVTRGAERLAAAPTWQVAVRAIAEQLLRDVADPVLRAALEAASIVRRFDEDLVQEMTREHVSSDTFRRLVELALVRPRRVGLSVHEDVRHVINADVRWRAPHRHRELRVRALAHYRRRARHTAGAERQRLLGDAYLLMEDTVVEALVFGDGSVPGEIELEENLRTEQLAELRELEGQWFDEVLRSVTSDVADTIGGRNAHLDAIDAVASIPEARLRLARVASGAAVGYSLVVPVTADTTPLLESHEFLAPALDALFRADASARTAPAAEPEVFQIVQVAYVGERASAANAALWRDMVELFARGGAYLMSATTDAQTALLADLGFVPLAPADADNRTAMLLDLRARPLDEWVQTDVIPAAAAPRLEAPNGEDPEGDEDDAGLVVRALSGFAVTRDGVDVTPTGVGGQLVRILAISGGELHFDVVAELLWPEVDPVTARTRFRNVLSRLRTVAGDLVERRRDRVRLAEEAVVDVQVFEDLAQRALVSVRGGDASGAADGVRAISMIPGAVLPTDPYADWAAGPRERIERQLVALLDALAEAAARDGGHDEAAQLYERAIEVQPFDERRYLRLAHVHVAAGRTGPGLATIERAMAMLDELGLPPTAGLRSFVDGLRARPAEAS